MLYALIEDLLKLIFIVKISKAGKILIAIVKLYKTEDLYLRIIHDSFKYSLQKTHSSFHDDFILKLI
jgi:hypothetical protein